MNHNYTCIIVDDESKAIELLADHIKELYDNIEIVGTYTDWKEALRAIRRNDFDLLFIDISMPGKTGIDLVSLVPDLKCEIIFVTAHQEHALQAFEHFASGYILKPVDTTIFTRTIDKILSRRMAAPRLGNPSPSVSSVIAIPNKNGLDYIQIHEVIYFEAKNRYTLVVTQNAKILSSYNLGYFKELVKEYAFFQTHRSFMVNLNFIKRYEKSGLIIMTNGDAVPISKVVRRDFLNLFSAGESGESII